MEVHISDPSQRPEEFRHTSVVTPHAVRVVAGQGIEGYRRAADPVAVDHPWFRGAVASSSSLAGLTPRRPRRPSSVGSAASAWIARMATTNDLKNGMVLVLDRQLWSVTEFQHVKPGKGPAFVRTKLKNVETNKTVDKTFNAGTKVETATVDRRTMQYLYNDGTSYVFMDTSTYDQVEIPPEVLGSASNFLLENQEAVVASNEGRVLFIELPASVELEITFTEPGVAGDSATGRTKPATLETGPRDPGPAVRHPGREGQGRHPRLLLHGPRQVLMAARSKARRRALDLLYAADLRDEPGTDTLERAVAEGTGPSNPYTETLVRGVVEQQERIDRLLGAYSEGWTLDRMPAVDRNVLRIGVWELIWAEDVPDAVAITEAMALVRELSTDDSAAFVNGILATISRHRATDDLPAWATCGACA